MQELRVCLEHPFFMKEDFLCEYLVTFSLQKRSRTSHNEEDLLLISLPAQRVFPTSTLLVASRDTQSVVFHDRVFLHAHDCNGIF